MDDNAYQLHTDNDIEIARQGHPALSPTADSVGALGYGAPQSHHTGVTSAISSQTCTQPIAADGHSGGMNKSRSQKKRPGKDVVVIAKSYYTSHSLRYPALLQAGKPVELDQLSMTTWLEIQAQLEPLIKTHLFLPKSYQLVPSVCFMAAIGWVLCFRIAAGSNQAYYFDEYGNYQAAGSTSDIDSPELGTVAKIGRMAIFFLILAFAGIAFFRWLQKRNHPVDEELREVCLELSRSKTQAEGYRLEYHKTGSSTLHDQGGHHLFATRVLRFVPLPIPTKISVPSSDASATVVHVQRQASSLSVSSDASSDYPTLQSLSSMDFAPFPTSDVILENLASLLFVLVIFQCVNSFL